MNVGISIRIVVAFVFLSGSLAGLGQAEERTVKAMATWQAQGLISKVEPNVALLVGALAGVLFVDGARER